MVSNAGACKDIAVGLVTDPGVVFRGLLTASDIFLFRIDEQLEWALDNLVARTTGSMEKDGFDENPSEKIVH